MKHADADQRFLVGLFLADLAVVLLFVGLGMTSHQTWNGALSLLSASYPFLLAWVFWGWILGSFRARALRTAWAAARCALVTWIFALPTAMLLRMAVLVRTFHWSFWVVAFTSGE